MSPAFAGTAVPALAFDPARLPFGFGALYADYRDLWRAVSLRVLHREAPPWRPLYAAPGTVAAVVAVHTLSSVLLDDGLRRGWIEFAALTPAAAGRGAPWQWLSWPIPQSDLLQLAATALGLGVFGRALEERTGAQRLGVLWLVTTLAAAGTALLARGDGGEPLFGAAVWVAACIGALATASPDARLTLTVERRQSSMPTWGAALVWACVVAGGTLSDRPGPWAPEMHLVAAAVGAGLGPWLTLKRGPKASAAGVPLYVVRPPRPGDDRPN